MVTDEQNKAITNEAYDPEITEEPFGKRWGGQTIELSEHDLAELRAGKFIALDVMSEYTVYLTLDKAAE